MLLGYNSELSVQNKILLYKQILKPVWSYGIQLLGCSKKSTIEIILKFQNKVLRSIVKAPWYIRNSDLQMDTFNEVIVKRHNQRRVFLPMKMMK